MKKFIVVMFLIVGILIAGCQTTSNPQTTTANPTKVGNTVVTATPGAAQTLSAPPSKLVVPAQVTPTVQSDSEKAVNDLNGMLVLLNNNLAGTDMLKDVK